MGQDHDPGRSELQPTQCAWPLGFYSRDPPRTLHSFTLCPWRAVWLMSRQGQHNQGTHILESYAQEQLASLLSRVGELAEDS